MAFLRPYGQKKPGFDSKPAVTSNISANRSNSSNSGNSGHDTNTSGVPVKNTNNNRNNKYNNRNRRPNKGGNFRFHKNFNNRPNRIESSHANQKIPDGTVNKNLAIDVSKIDHEKISQIFSSALKTIRPDDRAVLAEVKIFLDKLNKEIKKNSINAVAVLGGSIAKGTNLKDDHDCDIFVKFNQSYKNYNLSSMLQRILRSLKPEIIHGSRDYFHIHNNFCFEIVPVLDISKPEDALNVTDMSPLHVDWVGRFSQFKDEIRLAKLFCKAQKIYGAESYIQGFSGHVLDILTIYYKGFLNLLIASLNWHSKEVIDSENFYKGNSAAAFQKLGESKIDSPIIVIDPVLAERNAAAALSSEKLSIFQQAAKNFLLNPDSSFLLIKTLAIADLKDLAKNNWVVVLEATPLEGKEDVVGAKLLKLFTSIKNQLQFNDFEIIESGWQWKRGSKSDKALFWFIFPPKNLEHLSKRIGPPLNENDFVADFKQKHVETFIDNNRVCAFVKREFTNPKDFIKNIIDTEDTLSEKVAKIVIKQL